ncbi:unnamed protein product [Paramecium octaurelia]|uniref:Tetratricopeptide repeat protein n=1 Tax=Paramecium octaurelia TaxID=43137 RepID=A0A8S1UB86_PAROT|nr:unnamed protein product [Paramecium octaurelia]
MFNSQKVQICQLHESQICIGFCVSINCSSNSIYCQKCLEQFHEDHIDSCREFGQITKDLSNSIKQKEDHFNKIKEQQIQLHQLSRHQIDAYQEKIDELRNIQRNFQKKNTNLCQIKKSKSQKNNALQRDNLIIANFSKMEQLVQSLELRNKDCLINEKKSKLIKCIMKWLYIGGYWGISIIVIYLQIYVFIFGGCLLYVIHIELFNEWQPKQNQTYIELIQNQAQYFDIANDLYLMENYEESIIYYDKAIHLQQGNASSYFYKGNALTKLKFFKAAVANYNKYLKINSEKDAVYLNKGYALTQMKLFYQAIECYDLAIKINFHNDEAYYKKNNFGHSTLNGKVRKNSLKTFIVLFSLIKLMLQTSYTYLKKQLRQEQNILNLFSNSMFNSQKVQICQLHESQICIGFCVSINCSSNSIYCQKCLEQFHEDHIDSCREFGQITKDLSNSIKQKEDHFNKIKEQQIQLHQLSRHQIDAYQEKIDELRNIQRNFQKKNTNLCQIKKSKSQKNNALQRDNLIIANFSKMEQLVQSLELRNKDCLINEKKSKLIKCIMKWLYIGGYWGISIIVIYLQIYVFIFGGCLLYVIHIELFNEWQPKQNQTYIELIQNQAQYFDIANDLYLMENYEESIIYYDKAIHLQQGNASSYFYKGNALTKLKFFKAAVANYNKYLKINSEKDAVYLNKGYALTQMKLFYQAIECYDLAIKINFHNDEAYYKKVNHINNIVIKQQELSYIKLIVISKLQILIIKRSIQILIISSIILVKGQHYINFKNIMKLYNLMTLLFQFKQMMKYKHIKVLFHKFQIIHY